MTTYRVASIECRFADVEPEAVLRYLGHLRQYTDDAFIHAGTLVVRLAKGASEDDVRETFRVICARYDGIDRAMLQRVNDTVDVSWVFFYRYFGDELREFERITTGQGEQRPTTWAAYRPETFADEPAWPRRAESDLSYDLYDFRTQPVVYLQDRYGFHTVEASEAAFGTGELPRCLPPSLDETKYTELSYHVLYKPQRNRAFTPPVQQRIEWALRDHSATDLTLSLEELTSEYVYLRADPSPFDAPKRVVKRLRDAIRNANSEEYYERTDDESLVELDSRNLVRTHEIGAETRAQFLDPDTYSYDPPRGRRPFTYHLCVTFDGSNAFADATLKTELDKLGTDSRLEVTAYRSDPGRVFLSVACNRAIPPWVVAAWFRSRIDARMPSGVAYAVPWDEDPHVSMEANGWEAISEHIS